MYEFEAIEGYKPAKVHKVNEFVTFGIYTPEKKCVDRMSIINIYNTKTKSNIQLYSSTLITISDILITSILTSLNSLPPKIKNKKVPRKKK